MIRLAKAQCLLDRGEQSPRQALSYLVTRHFLLSGVTYRPTRHEETGLEQLSVLVETLDELVD
jgi:hypothetical protein